MESENRAKEAVKKGWIHSLRVRIGLFYLILATTNITFFSVMTFENQTDLLLNNFKLHSNDLVRVVVDDIGKVSTEKAISSDDLIKVLSERGIGSFDVVDKDGAIVFQYPTPADVSQKRDTLSPRLKARLQEMTATSTLIQSRYKLDLNADNFSVDFILPLEKTEQGERYLSTTLSVQSMQTRLRELYFQIALLVGWGILFHLLFAIFVYRVIFVRVDILKKTSNTMAEGDLSARATWNMRQNDELDELGKTFNFMASRIEENVETVTRLNTQIQSELEIGKEVQELFLPKHKVFEDYQMFFYYRPLREVSGDVYKYYRYSNGAKGFFFADASGHGVSAALITTITVMSLDVVVRRDFTTDSILTRLNQLLAARLESTFFCTGVFFLFEQGGGVQYTNAGHNPPLYLPAGSDEIKELEKDGPPMGMMDEAEYPANHINTSPGDRFLIYSDGLVESKSKEGEQFGLDRVKAVLLERRTDPTESTVTQLASMLDEHTGEYMDDVSIFYLEIPG